MNSIYDQDQLADDLYGNWSGGIHAVVSIEKHSNDIITIHKEPPTMISCTRFKHSKIFDTLQLTNNSMFHFYN